MLEKHVAATTEIYKALDMRREAGTSRLVTCYKLTLTNSTAGTDTAHVHDARNGARSSY